MKRLLPFILLMIMLPSCHRLVREDRRECPSFLFFDILNAPEEFQSFERIYNHLYSHPEGVLMEQANPSVQDIRERLFYFSIRGADAVHGYGLIGEEGLLSDGTEWRAPVGSDYVPLFRYSYMVQVQEESFVVPVELTKEYAKVSVQFVGMETYTGADGRFPFDVIVRGNTCGIDAYTGIPVRGAFEYKPGESGMGHFEFTLPRQADKDLVLEMHGREYISEHAGLQHNINLYDLLLREGGITWTEKNLPDLFLEIDFEETSIEVKVIPWMREQLKFEF